MVASLRHRLLQEEIPDTQIWNQTKKKDILRRAISDMVQQGKMVKMR